MELTEREKKEKEMQDFQDLIDEVKELPEDEVKKVSYFAQGVLACQGQKGA